MWIDVRFWLRNLKENNSKFSLARIAEEVVHNKDNESLAYNFKEIYNQIISRAHETNLLK